MAKGIVVKIWNIKEGSMGRGAGAQIKDSIAYITDKDKCDEHLSEGQIQRELTYVANDVKTLKGVYTGCKNVSDIKTATEEMMQVKLFFGKTGGRVALHGIVSVDETESDKRNAGKLMMLASDLLDEVFPDHQAVYAVHTNTENLHVHFVVNTVGLYGKKIHMDKGFMKSIMEPAVNRLAEKYGFTPNQEWKKEKKNDLTPYAERIVNLRAAIDEAIERSDDFGSFLADLKDQGITAQVGKYLSLKEEGMTRAVRSHRLGSRYTLESIKNRILTKREDFVRGEVSEIAGAAQPMGVYFRSSPLNRYADMTKKEKREAVRKLKSGQNPWQEQKEKNWQLERMADEFQKTANVYELIKAFSPNDPSAGPAMEEIVRMQKRIAEDKKRIRQNLRDYQPIIKLYEEAKKYETKAYLYESGREEFEEDFKAYKKLTERLRDGYSKEVTEIAEYLEDQRNELILARERQNELSSAYKTIKRFSEGDLKESIGSYESIFEAVGFSRARSYASLYSVFESSIKYVAADGAGSFLRVVIMPDYIDGRRTERADITVFDKDGSEMETFSSKDSSIQAFNEKLFLLKAELGLYRCHSFDSKDKAKGFAESQKEKVRGKGKDK